MDDHSGLGETRPKMPVLRYGTILAGAMRRWQPMPPPAFIVPLFSTLLSLQAIHRGIDLVRSPESTAEINAYVEVLGQDAFGWAFIAAGTAVLTSTLLVRRVFALIGAHALAACVYVGYALALTQGVLTMAPGFYGSRFAGAAAVGAIFWITWTLLLIVGMIEQLVGFRVFDRAQRAHRDATDQVRPRP